ncbi:helix-turn-helix domain-containing protein [Natronospora cellulosivora (SeqCode)]
MTIGEKLKNAREEKGATLKEVQEIIKIRKRYLEALENDDFDLIPGEAYIKAFIKGYANYLGLDYLELHQQYNQLQIEKSNQELEEEDKDKDKSNVLLHNKTLIATIFMIIIIVVLVFFYINVRLMNSSQADINNYQNDDINQDLILGSYSNTDNQNEDLKDDEDLDKEIIGMNQENLNTAFQDSVNQINNMVLEDESTVNYESNDIKEIELHITERTWLEISVDNNNIFKGELSAGERRVLEYNEEIELLIGNAIGVYLIKNGESLGPWGERGEVIRKRID